MSSVLCIFLVHIRIICIFDYVDGVKQYTLQFIRRVIDLHTIIALTCPHVGVRCVTVTVPAPAVIVLHHIKSN